MARKGPGAEDRFANLTISVVHADCDPAESDRAAAMCAAAVARYRGRWGNDQVLDVFQGQNGFSYLFDSSPSGRADNTKPANRVVAAWGYSKPQERVGDRQRLRRFPLPRRAGKSMDRGHLIALASGGGENVNIVPQASRLNRGHSNAGKRWRALERVCATTSDVFMFVSLEYDDVTDIPARFDFRLVEPNGTEHRDSFENSDQV